MADKDFTSPDWSAFAAKLIQERRETPKTGAASSSFVARMTSSAADPKAADAEGDEAGETGAAGPGRG